MRRCTAVCAAASLERFVLEAASGEYGIDGADAILCDENGTRCRLGFRLSEPDVGDSTSS